MVCALVIYLLCGITGVCVERRLGLNCLFKRVVVVFSVGAGQLMLSLESLSLLRRLTGLWFFVVNLALTMAVFAGTRWWPATRERLSWRALLGGARPDFAAVGRERVTLLLVGCSLAFLLTVFGLGLAMIPFGDIYHYEMPLFWIQNRSMLPFPVHNPRIVSFTCLAEGLGVPGCLYAHSAAMAAVVCLLGAVLGLWAVFSLARRIGAGFKAAACAAAVTSGYTFFAQDLFAASAGGYLAGAWFGASLVFLMDARSSQEEAGSWLADLGCSVFCFLMACGAKNSTVLLAPVYLVALPWCLKGQLWGRQSETERGAVFQPRAPAVSREGTEKSVTDNRAGGAAPRLIVRAGLVVAFCGLVGLISSGVAWNYATNKAWFRDSRGSHLSNELLSHDFHPRAIWTRLCRGAVLVLYDTIWIPKSAQARYAWVCASTAKALGAQSELVEDDDFFSFQQKVLTPRKGLGLLGVAVFLPGLVLGVAGWMGKGPLGLTLPQPWRSNARLLVAFATGSFVACHLVLRWQSYGVLRLMYPFIISGAPLCAVLLQRRQTQLGALVLLLVSSAMFLTLMLGLAARRLEWSPDRGALKFIARLQNPHTRQLRFQWSRRPAFEFLEREDYVMRELYQKLLEGLRQPSTLGLVGSMNTECSFLFGRRFQNRVIPLVDARKPEQLLEAPVDLDYVVVLDKFPEASVWAEQRGFRQVVKVTDAQGCLLLAFEKKPSGE